MTKKYDAIIVGAGIVGLAFARALGVRGKKVLVIERNQYAVGASIRNFGMIWPIGQPEGVMYERAMLSKSIWVNLANEAGIWIDQVGSLHLAYNETEWEVLSEFAAQHNHRDYQLCNQSATTTLSVAVQPVGFKGSLWSGEEMIVDAPQAIAKIPAYLTEKFGVDFKWGLSATNIETGRVYSGDCCMEAEQIMVCSGQDFEVLFPHVFNTLPITKCKLQMMRLVDQPESWRLGPSLCGGLSLIHYPGFKSAGSVLQRLKNQYEATHPDYLKWGIHVMASQNQSGEIIIGDSHEYGLTHDPFDRNFINQLIIDYLKGFARFPDFSLSASWNGIYSKMTDGQTECIISPMDGVTIINGLGGSGMTLSFGLAEEFINGTYQAFKN
jgi:FAD dependent oxidoreductase TIGR03364